MGGVGACCVDVTRRAGRVVKWWRCLVDQRQQSGPACGGAGGAELGARGGAA
jgi:hypothetical protein